MSTPTDITATDRYVSFCGIECDQQADALMAHLEACLARPEASAQWRRYFEQKLAQKRTMGHDHLFFIGAQMNTLYEFFESLDDEEGQQRLWRIEQECC
jgi:hypothetical protein